MQGVNRIQEEEPGTIAYLHAHFFFPILLRLSSGVSSGKMACMLLQPA